LAAIALPTAAIVWLGAKKTAATDGGCRAACLSQKVASRT
jgi:hypothetical protein